MSTNTVAKKKAGRPAAKKVTVTKTQAVTASMEVENSVTPQQRTRSRVEDKRKTRVPVSDGRSILAIDEKLLDPNFKYRWVNDDPENPGRVHRLKLAGWEVVEDSNLVIGDRTVNSGSHVGSSVTRNVGGGMVAFLMKIEKELWEEDQEALRANLRETENSMRSGDKQSSDYGSIKIDHSFNY